MPLLRTRRAPAVQLGLTATPKRDANADTYAYFGEPVYTYALKEGINEDLAKQLAKSIRTDFKKVTPQIQGDAVRVSAKNKDDLQSVIQALRKREDQYPVALQFVNYR